MTTTPDAAGPLDVTVRPAIHIAFSDNGEFIRFWTASDAQAREWSQGNWETEPFFSGQQMALAVGAASIPKGWALVPVEPTPAMVKAGALARHSSACDGGYSYVGSPASEAAYRAMVEAAPLPPNVELSGASLAKRPAQTQC